MKDENFVKSTTEADFKKIEHGYKTDIAIITARPILHKIMLFISVTFIVILFAIFSFVIVGYLVNGRFIDRKEVASMMNNIETMHVFVVDNSAKSLLVGNVVNIPLGDGKYDFYTTVQNSNTDWYAEFDYRFEAGGQSSEITKGFIMPNEIIPLLALRQDFNSTSNSELVVINLVWHRIDHHRISNIDTWLTDHNDFIVTNETYSRDVEINDQKIARLSFNIENDTAYNYWSVDLYLLLSRNGSVVGINKTTIPGFEAGEIRKVNMNWFDSNIASGDVSVYPIINYFDENVYMDQPSDETKVDFRDIEY